MSVGKQQRVAPPHDALLALVRRAPIDFHGEFVRAHHFRRIGEPFAHLGEEGQRSRARWRGSPRGPCRRAAARGVRSRLSTSAIVRSSFHCCAGAAEVTQHDEHATRTPWRTSRDTAANRGRMNGRSSDAPDGATGTLVPVWRDILLDADTPVAAFAKLRGAGPPRARSRSCSSRRPPAARRGRATRSWARSRAARGGSRTAWWKTGRRSAAGTTRAHRRIRSPISREAHARTSPSMRPNSAPSGAERSVTSRTTRCATSSSCRTRRRAA